MVFARYMKETWRADTILGAAVWFRIHQPLMTLTVVFSVVGFIVIASEKGFLDYSLETISKNAHPVYGFICILLALIQPVMAFFRPSPDHEKRWIFYWAHFFVGLLASIFCKQRFRSKLNKSLKTTPLLSSLPRRFHCRDTRGCRIHPRRRLALGHFVLHNRIYDLSHHPHNSPSLVM